MLVPADFLAARIVRMLKRNAGNGGGCFQVRMVEAPASTWPNFIRVGMASASRINTTSARAVRTLAYGLTHAEDSSSTGGILTPFSYGDEATGLRLGGLPPATSFDR